MIQHPYMGTEGKPSIEHWYHTVLTMVSYHNNSSTPLKELREINLL